MPLLQTSGNATADAYGGGAAAKVNYIEDCFVTWVSTGNGTSRTVTGPDMTAGGLSITKSRSAATGWHWVDTARGAGLSLSSNTTSAQATESTGVTAFTATGTSIGAAAEYNTNGATYVDYLLKKQPKFVDVVAYTGNGVSGRQISHNLGSAPGCIIVKCTSTTTDWPVYHKDMTSNIYLNLTNVYSAGDNKYFWGNDVNVIAPTSTVFTVGGGGAGNSINGSGQTYVAYLFAHNAGGFGLTGTDNVISCGSFTTDANGQFSVNLGYEPQFVITKSASGVSDWRMFDTMRGFVAPGTGSSLSSGLLANSSSAEIANWLNVGPNATGFSTGANGDFAASSTFIYIAIRRGPMKVPTSGTSVFAPLALNNGFDTVNTTGFPIDLQILGYRPGGAVAGRNPAFMDRLRGVSTIPSNTSNGFPWLSSANTDAELTAASMTNGWNNTGFSTCLSLAGNNAYWNFRRAPNTFDEVCYTGTGPSVQTLNHNLGKAPELMIIKDRSGAVARSWAVYAAPIWGTGIGGTAGYDMLTLDSSNAAIYNNNQINATQPTASVFYVGYSGITYGNTNVSGDNYVAYLFASCPGVSKVFSYTGNGSSQTIGCGFTAGARFVMIKRTDSTGDWYVWDTARGIVSGNDPHLSLNTTAAEVTTDDTIDPDSSGFVVNQLAATNCNVSGATYIGLAIA